MTKMDEVWLIARHICEIIAVVGFFILVPKSLFIWVFLLFTVMAYIVSLYIVLSNDNDDDWFTHGAS